MYAEGTYLTSYCYNYIKREKKIKFGKRILAASMALCVTGAATLIACKIPLSNLIEARESVVVSSESVEISSGTIAISEELAAVNNDVITIDKDMEATGGEVVVVDDTDVYNIEGSRAIFEKLIYKNVTEAAAMLEEAKPPVIFVDAGHGGMDGGCVSGKVIEKDVNLAIAKFVKERLEDSGYKVIMAREDDTFVIKEERVEAANSVNADIYVSIHQNFSEDSKVSGMEVWYDGTDNTRDNERLARLLKQQIIKTTASVERELRGNADFHVTGSTTMPSCLIETGFLSNVTERQKLVSEEYQRQIAEGIVNGISYYISPKTMYLTFDDGPTEENTVRVLDILKERGIKATFFLIGENVRKNPEIARRIVAEGHTIGIHSDSHNYDTIYESTENFIRDFDNAHQTVLEVTGVDAKLFRFPGGSINAYNKEVSGEIIEKMTERGYIYYDWNASLEDADTQKNYSTEELIANAVGSTLGRNKIVMLAHDAVYNTGLCLNELLDSFPEYEIKPLSEDVTPIQF